MAYHFRKLKQTIRIIPSTKSIGFSTRVNEGDQTKNTHLDGSPGRPQYEASSDQSSASINDELTSNNNSINSTDAVMSFKCGLDFLQHLQPYLRVRTSNLPVTYKDFTQVMLPRISHVEKAVEKDPIFSVVKSVGFTSDDILVDLNDSFRDTSINISAREQIPVAVLTQHHYRRLAHESVPSSWELPHLDHMLCDNSLQTFTDSNLNKPYTLYASDMGTNSRQNGNGQSSKDGPSPEQMQEVRDKLEHLVKNLFNGDHNYEILHKQVVLENNLFGDNRMSIGLSRYKIELLLLRIRIYIQLSNTSMEILSITTLEQTGVIRIHWRLKGLPHLQNLKFWRLFQVQDTKNKYEWDWLEAFSYFHIGKDGLVHKHRMDRMMPDDSQPDLTEKLRGLLNPAKPLVN